MMWIAGQRWKRRAVCVLETPDAPELWTPDRKPPVAVRVHLEQMCQRCPVRRECAAEALDNGSESGLYAGVWVPGQQETASWEKAMDRLAAIAHTTPAVGTDEEMAVPA